VHCLPPAAAEVSAERRAASTRLASLLERSEPGRVERAYTHHPALLSWAFHPRCGVPPRLQQSVAELWLRDGEAPSNAAPLLELLADQPAAVHPLLDVVTDGAPEEARQRAARLLARAASSSAAVADDLSAGLWARLPVALSGSPPAGPAALAAPARDGALLVWLAAEVRRAPPADMALRVASLLGGALARQRLGAEPRHLTAAMRILLHLLDDARRRCDPRVHTTLLGDARFAQALLAAARYKDPRTCTTALDLLRLLEQHKADLKVPVLHDSFTLEWGVILLAVNSVDVQVFEAGLLLLQEVLRPKEQKFLMLERDDNLLRPVYFVLQSKALKFKDVLKLGDTVWIVLRDLLPLSEMIVHQPWNHSLVCFTLKQGPMQDATNEVLSFVLRWLTLLAPTEAPEPTPRRPLPSLLTQTCVEIASALVNSDQEFHISSIARDMGKAVSSKCISG
ncbi:Meiosis inhibitor protein 1, partial [Frankliniella fusca]